MWIDAGELVGLLEKIDEAEASLGAYLADDTSDEENLRKAADALAELRKLVYRDIASADGLAEAGGGGRKYRIWKGEETK